MDDHKVLSNRHHTLAFTLYSLPLRTEHTTYANESTTEAYHKKQRTQRKEFYYTIAVQIYTDGHAVLVFALFFLNVFSLLI